MLPGEQKRWVVAFSSVCMLLQCSKPSILTRSRQSTRPCRRYLEDTPSLRAQLGCPMQGRLRTPSLLRDARACNADKMQDGSPRCRRPFFSEDDRGGTFTHKRDAEDFMNLVQHAYTRNMPNLHSTLMWLALRPESAESYCTRVLYSPVFGLPAAGRRGLFTN